VRAPGTYRLQVLDVLSLLLAQAVHDRDPPVQEDKLAVELDVVVKDQVCEHKRGLALQGVEVVQSDLRLAL